MTRPEQRKTSISLRLTDAAILDALGMSATEAIREFCASRGPDGMPLDPVVAAVQPVPGIIMLDDPEARDPHSDGKPDKPPVKPHGWRDGRARPATLDDAIALRDEARARGGDARLAASYVLLVEVP